LQTLGLLVFCYWILEKVADFFVYFSGEKMSREKGNNKQSTLSEYEQRRLVNIEENKRKLDALSVPKMNTLVQRNQPKKRTKFSMNFSVTIVLAHLIVTILHYHALFL